MKCICLVGNLERIETIERLDFVVICGLLNESVETHHRQYAAPTVRSADSTQHRQYVDEYESGALTVL